MNPDPKPRRETEVADFSEILSPTDGSEPPTIVGGHAANLWAIYFLSKGVVELSRYMPFTSKDLDLVGSWDLLERLHGRLKGKLSRSESRSPVLGRLLAISLTGGDSD